MSYFGHVQNEVEIEENLKIAVYYDRTETRKEWRSSLN